MKQPFAAFRANRSLAERLGTLEAMALLVVVVIGLVVGLTLAHRAGGASPSVPTAAPLSLYVGTNDGSIYKLDTQKRALRWSTQVDGAVVGAPVVVNGTVYLGLLNGEGISLVALNASTGKTRWSAQIESKAASEPTVAGGIVYITGNGDGAVYAFAASNGKLLWRVHVGGYDQIAVTGKLVYSVGSDASGTGYLYALDAQNGLVRWRVPAPSKDAGFSTPFAANGVVYAASSQVMDANPTGQGGPPGQDAQSIESYEYAYQAETGALLWQSDQFASVMADAVPTLAGGRLYLALNDGTVLALDAAHGTRLWSYPSGGMVSVSPWVGADTVSFGVASSTGPTGAIITLTIKDGSLSWQQTISQYLGTAFAVNAGALYLGSGDQIIHALKASDGASLWQYQYIPSRSDPMPLSGGGVAVTVAP